MNYDYSAYNRRYNYDKLAYLHRLLDLIFILNLNIQDKRLIMYNEDDEHQAELPNTANMNIIKRIELHKAIFRQLWAVRHKKGIRQLRLFR